MRVALLTMIEPAMIAPATIGLATPTHGARSVAAASDPVAATPADATHGGTRASLRIGGVSLARHQLGQVLALGCDRVICIAQPGHPELAALQAVAQQAGARLQVADGPHALLGMVTATEELIALADGLFADSALLAALLEPGPAVLVQPIERGLAAGFERIDINHAAAGAWLLPGRLVERLADLPPDCDAFSALQRIALQAGVGQRPLAATGLDEAGWLLVRGESEALACEAGWIRRLAAVPGAANPSLALSRMLVGAFGPALLHGGGGSTIAAAAGVAVGLLAAMAGWFAHPVAAFVLAALAWQGFLVSALLGRVIRAGLNLPVPRVPRGLVFGWAIDLLLVALADWAIRSAPAESGSAALGPEMSGHGGALFAAVMLVGLVRLVGLSGTARWNAWLQDRGLLALALAAGMALMPGMFLVRLLAVVALAVGLLAVYRRRLG